MEIRRVLLSMLFIVSVLMLWENYQISIGGTGFLGFSNTLSLNSSSKNSEKSAVSLSEKNQNELLNTSNQDSVSSTLIPSPQDTTVTVSTDVLRLTFSTFGAQLLQAELLKYASYDDIKKPIKLLENSEKRTYIVQTGLVGASGLANHNTSYRLVSTPDQLHDNQEKIKVIFESFNNGVTSQIQYILTRGQYAIDVVHLVKNSLNIPFVPSSYTQLIRDDSKPEGESHFYSTFTGPAVYSEQKKYQKIEFSQIAKGTADFNKNSDNGWIAMVQHYFVSAFIPEHGQNRENYIKKLNKNRYAVGSLIQLPTVNPNTEVSSSARLFIGPQDEHLLESLSPGLDLVRDYGWLTVIAKPLFWLLENLHRLVGNWGWAIVFLTVIVKLAFFPLSAASYKSMAKMRAVTPRLMRLREQHSNDRMRLNQAMMELYKTEKINPLGGCLPVVVQIPVFLALYWVLLASVEIRNAPWVGWITDLASPDPWYILPIVMAVSMFVQTKLNPTPPDPIQAKVMLFMPIVFSGMFIFFPSGLVLYWVVNNILSIAQQWYITNSVEKTKMN